MVDFITLVGINLAAISSIICFSYLFKDNPAFHIVESALIGSSVAYSLVYTLNALWKLAITPLVFQGNFIMLIPLLLGVLYLARLYPPLIWSSRYPIAVLIGVGTGLAARNVLQVNLLLQVNSAIKIMSGPTGWLDTIITVVGTICGTAYFLFTFHPKNTAGQVYRYLTRFGRIILMICFGAMFGNTIIGRFSLFIGTLQSLLWSWLGLGGV